MARSFATTTRQLVTSSNFIKLSSENFIYQSLRKILIFAFFGRKISMSKNQKKICEELRHYCKATSDKEQLYKTFIWKLHLSILHSILTSIHSSIHPICYNILDLVETTSMETRFDWQVIATITSDKHATFLLDTTRAILLINYNHSS